MDDVEMEDADGEGGEDGEGRSRSVTEFKRIRFKDRTAFFFGVLNTIATAALVGGMHTQWLIYYYSIKAPLLIGHRIYSWMGKGWHYYVLEFCYFGNLILLLAIWVFPEDERVFIVAYATTHGPLAWAVILFRNSLVFHSVDMTTSCFIHLTPGLVAYHLRWYTPSTFKVCLSDPCCVGDSCAWLPFLYSAVLPTLYFFVFGDKTGKLYQVINMCGPSMRVFMFGGLYIVFAFVSFLPVPLYYHYQELDFALLLLCTLTMIWNGAGYYIEVFGKRYNENFPSQT